MFSVHAFGDIGFKVFGKNICFSESEKPGDGQALRKETGKRPAALSGMKLPPLCPPSLNAVLAMILTG